MAAPDLNPLHTLVEDRDRKTRKMKRIILNLSDLAEQVWQLADELHEHNKKIDARLIAGSPADSDTAGCTELPPGPYALAYRGKELDNGTWECSISINFAVGKEPFLLPPLLGGLLDLLATGKPESGDLLVSWRSDDELEEYLKARRSRTGQSTRYVTGLIYLLRNALFEHGYPRKLIQRNPAKGVRLAVLARRRSNHDT